MNSYAINDIYTIDVTHAVAAWAAGENEGGFIMFGQRSGGAQFLVENMNVTAARRPSLEVYAR